MMYRLRTRAECYDNWNKAVKEALDASDENKLGMNILTLQVQKKKWE